MDTKVNLQVVASHRTPISQLGGTLGTQFFKAEARAGILEFEKKKMEVEQGGNVEFCLNRTPRRFRVTSHEILGVVLAQDPLGATKVVLNPDSEDEKVTIPVTTGMEKIGMVTSDAIGKALKNDKNIIFSNAQKLVDELNSLNMEEKNRIVALINTLNNCVKQIDSAIDENKKKAAQYMNELLSSAPKDPMSGGSVVIDVNKGGNNESIVVTD